MKPPTPDLPAAHDYELAYEAHYRRRNLPEALERYKALILDHPRAAEAGFARSQILNIVRDVVPQDELFETQMSLAMAHLRDSPSPEPSA